MTFPARDSVDTYGGLKANFSPVVDPTTDESADDINKMKASVAGMTGTCEMAWARVTLGTSPTLTSSDACWGNDVSIRPAVAHTGTGTYTITWPSTITDGVGTTQSVNFRYASKPAVEGATLAFAQASVTAANVVTINTWNASGSANDLTGVVLLVKAG